MAIIDVDEKTAEVLAAMARAFGVREGEIVQRLVGLGSGGPAEGLPANTVVQPAVRATSPIRIGPESIGMGTSQVSIYALYKGHRVNGKFDPRTHQVWIDDGALAGKRFNKPSPAGCAVVQSISPERRFENTNGWEFWRESKSGKSLNDLFGGN